jgi:2-polyprenyl-3-methyl-5-hydroxy-6-metoxy-1,4-benzoquinol methylase
MKGGQMDYRARIYQRYSSIVQGVSGTPTLQEMDRWGEPYDFYLRGWLPGDRAAPIADVACGHGRLIQFFSRRGYTNVCGVDVSAEQVAIARTISPQVELGDAMEFLGRNVGRFALITALDIVEHFSKNEVLPFLDACHAALRPGGALIIQTPNADSPWSLGVRYGDFTHEICVGPQVMKALLDVCGFHGFEAREQGPFAHGPLSLLRVLLWRCFRAGMIFRNLVETGSAGSGVHTRVFIARSLRG